MRNKVNRVLAVIVIAAICIITVGTMVQYGRNYAYGLLISYKDLLPENPTFVDNIRARISKLESNATNRLMGLQWLRHVNASLQLLMGKQIISVGANNMVKLKCGAYYSLFNSPFVLDEAEALCDFADKLREEYNIPTAMVYCQSGLYEDGQLPEGMEALDTNIEAADAITTLFRSRGLSVTDSRDAFARSGLTNEQAVNKSDVHWTHRMALETAYLAAQTLNADLGLGLDAERLDPARFEEEVYPALLLGEYGRRIGVSNVTLDDIHLLYPAYDTNITYEELNSEERESGVERQTGTFREAVVRHENLERDPETGYSEQAYYIYGHYLAQTHTINEDGADQRILIFKDSFGTHIAAFLGLTAREVYAVDLRSTDLSMEYWVNEIQPDLVIFAYSQQMLRKFDYVIAE